MRGEWQHKKAPKYLEKPLVDLEFYSVELLASTANVMVIGGGVSGKEAARMAAGLGANVTILDTNLDRLRELESIMPANVTPVYSNSYTIEEELKRSHLIIGTVLIPGSKAPKLIRKEMLSKMIPRTVWLMLQLTRRLF